jgi:hypothetical protein
MKAKMVPYLSELLPSILNMATLNPEMGIEGKGTAEINDVL